MKRKALSLISIATLLFASAGLSFAQTDAPASDAPAKADQPQVIEKSLMDMWNAGGWTMYPLGLFAIFGTTLIIVFKYSSIIFLFAVNFICYLLTRYIK